MSEDSSVFGADESDSDVRSTASSEVSSDALNVPRNKGGRPRKVKRGSCPGPGRGHKKLRKQNDSVNSSRHCYFTVDAGPLDKAVADIQRWMEAMGLDDSDLMPPAPVRRSDRINAGVPPEHFVDFKTPKLPKKPPRQTEPLPINKKDCAKHAGMFCAAKDSGHYPEYYNSLYPVNIYWD